MLRLLSRAKMVNITLALRTTRFLEKEHEYMPWQTARNNLDYILLMFDRSEVFGPIQVRPESHLSHLKPACRRIQPLYRAGASSEEKSAAIMGPRLVCCAAFLTF